MLPEEVDDHDLVAPALANRDSMFEAARQKLRCDDDETTAPSFSEDSCSDMCLTMDGRKTLWTILGKRFTSRERSMSPTASLPLARVLMNGWRRSRASDKVLSESLLSCTSSWASVVKTTCRSESLSWQRLRVSRSTSHRQILRHTPSWTLLRHACVTDSWRPLSLALLTSSSAGRHAPL